MHTRPATGLIPISVATLHPNALLGVDVYLRPSAEATPILFFAGNEPPDVHRLAPLAGNGVNKLFIAPRDRSTYQRYLRENWTTLLADESPPIQNRIAVMSEVMRAVLDEEFSSADTDRIVDASVLLGISTCKLLADHRVLAKQICNVLHRDDAPFTHCTNVSLYSYMLARALQFSEKQLQEITVGGLLHDLGKLKTDEKILNKPGKLTDSEFSEIKKHPSAGYMELVERTDITYGQLMMCYQHHERLEGTGYPVGCTGDEIHEYAKLCAIVDVYEALTSQRPYRKPMSACEALAVLDEGAGTEYDEEMLQCWRTLILPHD